MMALNFRFSNVGAIRLADGFDDEINVGAAVAAMRILSGAQPADPDTTETGTLLASIDYVAVAFGAATDGAPGGLLTAASVPRTDASADNTGTAGYFRMRNDDTGTPDDVADGECGTSGADLNLNTLEITSGSAVELTSQTVTMPET